MSPLKIAVVVSLLIQLVLPAPLNTADRPATGSLEGVIWFPHMALVEGATVIINCASAGIERAVMTDSKGAYEFNPLPPATDCVVEVSFPGGGYSSVTQDRIVIKAGKTTVENFQLFAAVEETVVVSAKSVATGQAKQGGETVYVQTWRPPKSKPVETAGVTAFSAEFLEGVPLLGRNYQGLMTLAAGVIDSGSEGNPNILASRAELFKAIVDGVSNQDVAGGTFASNLNTDAIEAVEIVQSGGKVTFAPAQGGLANITYPLGDGRGLQITFNTESYQRKPDNPFRAALRHPLSTFAIDVDTASYSNIRRYLARGALPPPDAVRIEEMINYFDYGYPPPDGDHPFSVDVETTGCPWALQHRLVRVGLKGDEGAALDRPAANLVFLLDVSGSMGQPHKLPLVKRSMRMLVNHLNSSDTVAIVVYAGAAGLVLPATSVASKEDILDALGRLSAGGSTAGGAGIHLAYKIARKNFLQDGINRVILATDGDFNVGVSSTGDMSRLIEKEAKSGVFFTVLGYGMGNLKDDKLETLADKGNGHYAYIDSLHEARKVLVEELGATLVTIAKDVKIQVEFNPALVQSYRLIGYKNRMLRSEDFNDDTKDAGEIGAGHTVTALYEVVPTAHQVTLSPEDELKYQRPSLLSDAALDGELLTVKVRYKDPTGDVSRLLEVPVTDAGGDIASASPGTRFAAAVACLGMILRDAPDRGTASLEEAERLAMAGLGDDLRGHRAGFMQMIQLARKLESAPDEQEN